MNALTPDGTTFDLGDDAVAALRGELRGQVLLPGEGGYDNSRTIWNGMFDRRPALVARPRGAGDVMACVNFARHHGIAFTVKGGGHNVAGLASCEGGLLIDLTLMRGVWVDPLARIVRAQAGCVLGDVDRETQLHGQAAVLGFVSETGIAGLTLGGGFGYLTRKRGWTCDTLRAVDIVTAEGHLVRASDTDNEDVFWALKGGGGNFGVAVGFEYETYAVGPEIFAGAMAWSADEAPRVLDVFREVMADAAPELVCIAVLRKAPPAPWLDASIHGQNIVLIVFCHTGKVEDGEKAAQPFKEINRKVGDVCVRRSYVSQQSLLDATQPKGRRYYWKSEYLPGLQPDMLTAATADAADSPSLHSAILIFPLDGALNQRRAETSPMGNRDAKAVFNVAAAWDDPAGDEAAKTWARSTWDDLRRFSTGGSYVNFQAADEGDDRMASAYGDHLERLSRIKAKWDPDNLFRTNRNIVPKG